MLSASEHITNPADKPARIELDDAARDEQLAEARRLRERLSRALASDRMRLSPRSVQGGMGEGVWRVASGVSNHPCSIRFAFTSSAMRSSGASPNRDKRDSISSSPCRTRSSSPKSFRQIAAVQIDCIQ